MRILVLAAFNLALGFAHPVVASDLWVAPNHTAIDYQGFLRAGRLAEWRMAFDAMAVFKFPVAAFVSEPSTADLSPEAAGTAPALALDVRREAMRLLVDNGKQIAVEVGGLYEFRCAVPGQAGEQAALYDLAVLDRIHRPVKPGGVGLGGRVDYLVMDGPISRVIDAGRPNDCDFRSVDQAVRELTDYMRAIRARYPGVGFVWLINVPNWQLYGQVSSPTGPTGGLAFGFRNADGTVAPVELSTLVSAVVTAAEEAGIPLAAIHLDTPYDFSTPDRMPVLLRLADQITGLGIKLGVSANITRGIHWDPQKPFNNLSNPRNAFAAPRKPTPIDEFFAREFKAGAIYSAYAWQAQLGRSPDHLVVQSFFQTPFEILPERAASSFMNTVRDLATLAAPQASAGRCSAGSLPGEHVRLAGSNLYFRRDETGLCLIPEPTGDLALLEAMQAQLVATRGASFIRNCQAAEPARRFCAGSAPPVPVRSRFGTPFAALTSDYGCKRLPQNHYRMAENGLTFYSNGADAVVVLGPQSYQPPVSAQVPILGLPVNLCMRVDGALP